MAPAPRSGAASDALSELDVDSGNADSVGLLDALLSLNYDLRVLIGCKSLRLFGDGMLGVIFVLFLEACKFDEEKMGTLLSLTLIGNSVSSLLVTTYADRVGRKRMLLFCSMNAVATGAIFSVTSSFYVLLITSVCGMISTSGNEAGPFQPIELAALSEGLSERLRTRLITFYLLFSMIASAFGALLSGLTIQYLIDNSGFHELSAYRVIMCAFTFINVALTCLYSTLTPSIEVHQENDHSKVYTEASSSKGSSFFGLHKSKVLVLQLSVVFALDSFASSFITESLTTAWFQKTYDTSDSVLGFVVFLCNLLGGLSTVMAPRIADYLGLILAMVCTHLPSNLLVILVPLMPNEPLAVAVLALKYCIGEMDTPIRHAFVNGAVEPDERSAANGIAHILRLIAKIPGPFLAVELYQSPQHSRYPFFVAGTLKVIYDLILIATFQDLARGSGKDKHARIDKQGDASSNDVEKESLLHSDPVTQALKRDINAEPFIYDQFADDHDLSCDDRL